MSAGGHETDLGMSAESHNGHDRRCNQRIYKHIAVATHLAGCVRDPVFEQMWRMFAI